MIRGIEHVAIASPDPATLAKWYVETLGFSVCYESATTTIVRAPDGSMIEITTSQGERVPQDERQPGLRHVALAVDDFDAAYELLRARGVSFEGEPSEKKGVKTVFFKDPEGNLLHLIYRREPLG